MKQMVFGATLLSMTLAGSALRAQQPAAPVDFNRDIRPILSAACFQCHGPDLKQREADLRLDTKVGLFGKRDEQTPVVSGKLKQSALYLRITSDDEDERMPPSDSGGKLSPRQIDLIKRWIEQGAEWKGHWSYLKPVRLDPPQVEQQKFVRNDVDRFILARLNERGLKPAPEADRVTLIRRLSFDLVGLPPTPQQVDAFVRDTSPNAYEKQVDRLLNSPQFGERMAMYWLDLVRYADTNGIHGDNHRDVSLYRDYVINAFNANKPFDRFTVEQLAGDLLPNPTDELKIASGYNRLLMTTREGGAQAKEYLAKYAADRVRSASSVWMAATMLCAECHDHKYDPFTMKDFYSLAAFFADLKETAVGRQAPTRFPTQPQSAQIRELEGQITSVGKRLATQTPELDAAQVRWERSLKDRQIDWFVLRPINAVSKQGATLQTESDGTIHASGANPDKDEYTLTIGTMLKGITALRLEVLPEKRLPNGGPGRGSNGNFVLKEIKLQAGGKPIAWSTASATHSQKGFPIVGAVDGKPNTGWGILEQPGRENHAVFETKADVGDGVETILTITLVQNHGGRHTIGRFRIAATTDRRPIRADGVDAFPKNISAILAIASEKRTASQKQALAAHYRTIAPSLEPARKELARLKKRKSGVENAAPTMLVSLTTKPRTMRILPRGNWLDDSGPIVEPAVPAILANSKVKGRQANRLDLARWLVSPDNPLTSRVFVNRLWKLTFGRGLVSSLEDFGSQGAWPTHPELLDWLAVEFMQRGWDVKQIMKLMVMSGTYRQVSTASAELRQQDPFNKWLARQGRFRLDAEMVRDNALAVSGLLVKKIGGPSVKPYQPAGYWAHLNFPKRVYKHDVGENQYRRGLYTYWCRTFLHPSLRAFDAPTREECTIERPRSNTPLQALVLLNDPTYVEAARAFAERIIREGGQTAEDRIRFAYRESLSRRPKPAEMKLLTALQQKHLAQFQSDRKAADELLTVGLRPAPKEIDSVELAAWISVARVIFNLHETITRY